MCTVWRLRANGKALCANLTVCETMGRCEWLDPLFDCTSRPQFRLSAMIPPLSLHLGAEARSNENRNDETRFGGECPVGYEVVFIDEEGVMLRTGSVVNVRMKRESLDISQISNTTKIQKRRKINT